MSGSDDGIRDFAMNSSPKTTGDTLAPEGMEANIGVPAPVAPADPADAPDAVPLRLPFHTVLINSVAFAFSALLSPYLVIPAGTVGIVATAPSSKRQFLLWTAISVFFSTIVPALYVILQVVRGKITDVHVMEREQRGGPFVVALVSSLVGAIVLHQLKAPAIVWCIGVVLFFNGLVMLWITKYWKISIHVAVLSSTIFTALLWFHDIRSWELLWLIPALMWARIWRGRHTIWQGLAACSVSGALTAGVVWVIRQLPSIFG